MDNHFFNSRSLFNFSIQHTLDQVFDLRRDLFIQIFVVEVEKIMTVILMARIHVNVTDVLEIAFVLNRRSLKTVYALFYCKVQFDVRLDEVQSIRHDTLFGIDPCFLSDQPKIQLNSFTCCKAPIRCS